MGICPCVRDRESFETLKLLPGCSLESINSTADSDLRLTRRCSEPKVTLRALEQIIRLVGPLSGSYRNLKLLKLKGRLEVYTGEIPGSKQPCVVTKIPKSIHRFPQQAKNVLFDTLKRLDHPHLLRMVEMCQDDQYLYVITDCLRSWGRFTESQAAVVFYQVLSALSYYHGMEIAHKHVNLQTLVLKSPPVDDKFDIRLIDLYTMDADLSAEDQQDPTFIPPEGNLHSEKTDIWACGVLLYFLISGNDPFEATSRPTPQCKGYSFPPCIWKSISPVVVKLIVSMLKYKPADRPTAAECLMNPWLEQLSGCQSFIPRSLTLSLTSLQSSPNRKSLKEAILNLILSRVLAGSEIATLADAFRMMDLNGDGLISVNELVQCFETVMNVENPRAEAEIVLDNIDKNFNGMIEYSEFLVATMQRRKLLSRETLKAAFSTLDRDGNGRISAQELKYFFRIDHTPGSCEQWQQLIDDFDTSRDGLIDFNEFSAMMTKALSK